MDGGARHRSYNLSVRRESHSAETELATVEMVKLAPVRGIPQAEQMFPARGGDGFAVRRKSHCTDHVAVSQPSRAQPCQSTGRKRVTIEIQTGRLFFFWRGLLAQSKS